MADILPLLHIAVEELHYLTGIEAICLAEVYEQSLVTRLRLVLAPSARHLCPWSIPASSTLCRRLLNNGRILVVVEEAAKGHRHHLLYNILLVDILELAHDVSHIRGNLLLVDIGLHDGVHLLVELLLAYLLRRWQGAINKLLAYLPLNVPDLSLLFRVDDGYRRTFLACTACTSGAVGIVLYVVGQSVIDDMGEVVDIKSSCCHIGGNKQLHGMLPELLHRKVSLLLAQVTMECLCVVTVLYQLVGNFLCLHLCTAEDDGKYLRIEVHDTFQGKILVSRVYHIIYMVYMFRTLVSASHYNFLVVVEIALGNPLHLLAHSSREQQGVTVGRHILEYLVDGVGETHIEHLVGLIEHHILYIVALHHPTVHEVDETAWRSNDNLHAMPERAYLRLYRRTTIHGSDMQAVYVFGKVVEIICNLQAQLTSRAEHQCLRHLVLRVYLLQRRNAVGGCLARSCLRESYHVVAVTKQIGYNLLLNRHGLFKSQFLNGAANLLANAQFFKCLQN